MRKYMAEFLGTFILVLFGCGSAVVLGGLSGGMEGGTLGVTAIALAFGLSLVASAYAVGPVSGCHVNPAVSLGMLLAGRMGVVDFIGYVVAQVAGAFAASGLLLAITRFTGELFATETLGENGYDSYSTVLLELPGALIVEVVLTFVFVLTVLGVTASEKTAQVAGIVTGLALTLVHIIGIPLTGTSVNPARSLAPAVLIGGEALSQVWVFVAAPLAGAILAALAFRFLRKARKPRRAAHSIPSKAHDVRHERTTYVAAPPVEPPAPEARAEADLTL
jgi:aquaporin Z